MTPVRLEPATLRSRVKHSTTEPLGSLELKVYLEEFLIDDKGLDVRKPVFGGLLTTKVLTSLRIRADLSAPLLFAFWKVPYVNLLQVKFQFSS